MIFINKELSAQEDSVFQLVKTYPVQVSGAVFDNLDNLYLVTNQDQLKKYNANGDSVAVFNGVKRFGKLYFADVSNPLKLILFYKDFSNVVILDRLLSIRGTIDLRQHNILQASTVAISYDNNIWVFDSYESKLKKLNEQGSILQETPDFRVIFGEAITPQQIIDRDGMVYLYDSTKGVYIFDNYGTFKRRLPITKWANLIINGKNILGINANGISSFSSSTLLEKQYQFPKHFLPYYKYNLSQNKLIAFSKDSVSVFSYKY